MAKFNRQKHWWIVIIALVVIGLGITSITNQWMPHYQTLGDSLAFGLIGIGFCWVYSINRERLWWAIIPGLALFTLLAAILSDLLIGTDPENDWIGVLVIGVGALIIAAVLRRMDARLVLLIVAMFSFLVGIAMAPISWALKGILIAADVLALVFYVWRKRDTLPKSR